MKRLWYSLAFLPFVGCASVKGDLNAAKDALLNPPNEVMQEIQQVLAWILNLVVGFLSQLGGSLLGALGL